MVPGVADAESPAPKQMAKSLPAEAFRSPKFYELERRAIFQQKWILVSHALKFKPDEPGSEYISQEFAGIPYFIIRTKDGFKAFHNSCRHRGFPIITKPEGHLGERSVLACMYHSWSYRQDGSLIKAPKFQDQPDFKKEENGLFPIHLHVTDKGFIFLNFSAEEPEPFESYFGDLPLEWAHLPVDEYEYAYSWSVVGSYNWKTLMDGYQECYHCQVGHPGFAKALKLDEYRVLPFTNFARHTAPLSEKECAKSGGQPPTFTFTYPATGVTTCAEMFYLMRTVPIDATTTRMEYDVFKRKSMSMDDLRKFMVFYEAVEQEDFDLCSATQISLNAGVYSKGILHPERENGVLYYQKLTSDYCMEHFQREQQAGKEIQPVRPASQIAGDDCEASKICSALNASDSKLAW